MKSNLKPHSSDRLESLAVLAKDYALHMMRTSGSVPPTVIADTAEGYVFCMPTALTDASAKDRFAEVAKLFAIACKAQALVMIVEAWVRLPDASGYLDPNIRPSQADDRREMVALLLEDHGRSATRLVPIIRSAQGDFTNLGDGDPLVFGDSEGRFSKLMPSHKPSSSDVDRASHQLSALRMSVQKRGFDPSMN